MGQDKGAWLTAQPVNPALTSFWVMDGFLRKKISYSTRNGFE